MTTYGHPFQHDGGSANERTFGSPHNRLLDTCGHVWPGPGSDEAPGGSLVIRLPGRLWLWLANGLRTAGTVCGEWLERGTPRSK
jgi:hypothetical protein